jgi:archaeosine-15-forming tRNA-guanine transglycosylase
MMKKMRVRIQNAKDEIDRQGYPIFVKERLGSV